MHLESLRRNRKGGEGSSFPFGGVLGEEEGDRTQQNGWGCLNDITPGQRRNSAIKPDEELTEGVVISREEVVPRPLGIGLASAWPLKSVYYRKLYYRKCHRDSRLGCS